MILPHLEAGGGKMLPDRVPGNPLLSRRHSRRQPVANGCRVFPRLASLSWVGMSTSRCQAILSLEYFERTERTSKRLRQTAPRLLPWGKGRKKTPWERTLGTNLAIVANANGRRKRRQEEGASRSSVNPIIIRPNIRRHNEIKRHRTNGNGHQFI